MKTCEKCGYEGVEGGVKVEMDACYDCGFRPGDALEAEVLGECQECGKMSWAASQQECYDCGYGCDVLGSKKEGAKAKPPLPGSEGVATAGDESESSDEEASDGELEAAVEAMWEERKKAGKVFKVRRSERLKEKGAGVDGV